jgi:hypothetical protein
MATVPITLNLGAGAAGDELEADVSPSMVEVEWRTKQRNR